MRIYIPATMTSLRALIEHDEIGPAPIAAFAVTPSLREWYIDDDIEELEYAALLVAARKSLLILPDNEARRVVIAADVAESDARLTPDIDRAAVAIEVPVSRAAVASVHLDGSDAESVVRAAVSAIKHGDLDGDDIQFLVDQTEGFELEWYATQEIRALLQLS